MVIEVPESFSREDYLRFEAWLEKNNTNLPSFVDINGILYRVIGVYDEGKLISVRVAN